MKYGDLTQPIRTEPARKHGRLALTIVNHLKAKLPVAAERLFEPFYRNPSDADSGLGLAIVKELTEKLGGTISTNLEAHRLEITIEFKVRGETGLRLVHCYLNSYRRLSQ